MAARFNRQDVVLGAIPVGTPAHDDWHDVLGSEQLPNHALDWEVLAPGTAGQVLTTNTNHSLGWLQPPHYNVQAYGAVGDGITDDTLAINACFAAAAATPGAFVVFPATTAFYLITGPIRVLASASILGGGATTIAQQTQYKPVFDLFNVNNCLISGFTLVMTGGPFVGMGTGFRGDATYAYNAGIWTNGSGHTFRDLVIQNFCMGIYFSPCNSAGTALVSTLHAHNSVSNIEVSGANHGVLASCQSGLRIDGLYSHDHFDSSGGVNPTHAIYLTGDFPTSKFTYDVVLSNCVCVNNAYGAAYQFKVVTGAVATNLLADNCNGLFNGLDIQDCTLTGLQALNDVASILSTFTILKAWTQPARVNVTGLTIMKSDDLIPITCICDDLRLANVNVSSNHSGVATSQYDVQIRGNNIVVDGVRLHNRGSSRYRAFLVGTTGYTTSNVTISNLDINNYLSICEFDTSVTGVNVVNYSPGLIRNMAGTGSNYIDQLGGIAAFNISRHPWTTIRTITAGAVSSGILGPYPPLETTTVFAVVDSTGFNILPPRCLPKAGMKQEIIIFNNSSGSLGTITWDTIYTFRSAPDLPAAGMMISLTFYFNGTNWVELSPSMPALT